MRSRYVIFFVATFIISGCASMLPSSSVTLATTKATTYYSVRATTTCEIFDEIRRRRLREQDGEYAAGLASSQSGIKWSGRDTRTGCRFGRGDDHAGSRRDAGAARALDDMSGDLQERWQRFASAIAAHEQRHVDIFENAATAVKARIEAVLKKSASCVDVGAAIRDLWRTYEVETEKAQRAFDVEDRARIDNDRKPLLDVIEIRKAELTALTAELRQLQATLEDLRRRVGAIRHNVDAVQADIAKADGSCSRPTDRTEVLCHQYNALVASQNALVTEHSSSTN